MREQDGAAGGEEGGGRWRVVTVVTAVTGVPVVGGVFSAGGAR